MIEQLNKEAREAGFLIFGDYEDPDLYIRQINHTNGIFIEKTADNKYICYRIKWNFEPSDGVQHIRDEKLYCRGNLRRCLNKAKSVIDFWLNGPKKRKKVRRGL